jgi:hypothetical protein
MSSEESAITPPLVTGKTSKGCAHTFSPEDSAIHDYIVFLSQDALHTSSIA